MFKRIIALGIIAGVVLIAAGCDFIKSGFDKKQLDLSLHLDVDPQIQVGETVTMKLKVFNNGSRRVTLFFGEGDADFIVTEQNGTKVWNWLHDKTVFRDILFTLTLNPYEGKEVPLIAGVEKPHEANWHQEDNDGNPVPPGIYLIRGILRFSLEDPAPPKKPVILELRTKQQKLFIIEANSLALQLEVPSEVQAGAPVPLKLKVKNISDLPLMLFGGYPQADFVVTKPDGTEVWRWSYSKAFPLVLIRLILQPGEEREYEEQWEQVDNDGRPIQPGMYLLRGIFGFSLTDEPPYGMETESQPLIIYR